jgi:hypothetical protein
LQPVSAGWNPCHVEQSRDSISNDEIRMTNDETNPNEEAETLRGVLLCH